MSLPDRNAPWPTIVKYFTKQKADGESLAVVLKRASAYRKTGKVTTGGKMPMQKRNTKRRQNGTKRRQNGGQKNRQPDGETDLQTDRQPDGETNLQTGQQDGGKKNRQQDGETGRQQDRKSNQKK